MVKRLLLSQIWMTRLDSLHHSPEKQKVIFNFLFSIYILLTSVRQLFLHIELLNLILSMTLDTDSATMSGMSATQQGCNFWFLEVQDRDNQIWDKMMRVPFRNHAISYSLIQFLLEMLTYPEILALWQCKCPTKKTQNKTIVSYLSKCSEISFLSIYHNPFHNMARAQESCPQQIILHTTIVKDFVETYLDVFYLVSSLVVGCV